jgi:DNA-binding transcriptional LysR family regulator
MHLEALSIFCDVVRHQSFSRGAMANSVSQSAASQAIRQIEKRLNTQLIDRSKRPWQLTAEGRLFFKGCQEIVERYHELEKSVQQRQHPSGYTVRLASIYSVHLHDLSHYIEQFQSSVPGASVDLEYIHPDQVYERVLNDQSDLGLISFANPGRELTAIPWQNQTMVVACLPGHRFTQLASEKIGLHPRSLDRESFVTFDRGLPVRREIDRYLRRREVNVRVVAEFDNIENIKQAVEDGAGTAILPEPTLQQEVQRKTLVTMPLRLVDDEPPFVRPLSIIHRRKRRLNPAVTEFIELLRAARSSTNAGARRNSPMARGVTRRSEETIASRPRKTETAVPPGVVT